MSSSATTLDYNARGIALLQSSQLINSLVNTEGGAKHFLGLPNISPEALTFFPPVGARNATIGLMTLILSLRGDRVGVATSFALSCIPGFVDAWTCVQRGGNWQVHVVTMGVMAVTAGLLVRQG